MGEKRRCRSMSGAVVSTLCIRHKAQACHACPAPHHRLCVSSRARFLVPKVDRAFSTRSLIEGIKGMTLQ